MEEGRERERNYFLMLARRAEVNPDDAAVLAKVLGDRIAELWEPALEAAMQAAENLGYAAVHPVIDEVIAKYLREKRDLALVANIYNRIPPATILLKQTALEVSRLTVEEMEGDGGVESNPVVYLLRVLNYVSRLVDVAKMPEAEVEAERAELFARKRFAHEPDMFRIILANCLETLGMIRSEQGRHSESRELREEAINLLGAAGGQEMTLAQCHNSLAGVLRCLGDPDGALRNCKEAVRLYRGLVPIEREAWVDYSSGLQAFVGDPRPSLADALIALSTFQNDAGKSAECLASAQEAFDIFTELAADFPDSFSDHLGMVRHNLGMAKFGVGDGPGGLREIEESAYIFEVLARIHPQVYEPTLAHTLSSVVRANLKLHRFSEALSRAMKLVDLSRRLHARSPSKFLSQHLFNLELLVSILREAGQNEETALVLDEIARLSTGPTSQEPDSE